jgi:hypothetical protein
MSPKAPAGNPNWVSKKPDSPITYTEAGIDKNLADRALMIFLASLDSGIAAPKPRSAARICRTAVGVK